MLFKDTYMISEEGISNFKKNCILQIVFFADLGDLESKFLMLEDHSQIWRNALF